MEGRGWREGEWRVERWREGEWREGGGGKGVDGREVEGRRVEGRGWREGGWREGGCREGGWREEDGGKTDGGGSNLRLASVDTMSGGDGEVGADEDGATVVTSGPLLSRALLYLGSSANCYSSRQHSRPA